MQGFPEQRQVLHIPRGVWHQAISWYRARKESKRPSESVLIFIFKNKMLNVYNFI